MLIPIGTDRPLRRPTLVNYVLVGLNIGIFLSLEAAKRMQPELWGRLDELFVLNPLDVRPWALLTYAFLHATFWHLLGNMVFLWVFGPNVEDRFGRVGYLLFYLVSSIIAGGLHALVYQNPVVGASGAIAAVTGAYLVLFPKTRIRTVVMMFVIGVFEIPAWWLIGSQIAWNLFMQGSGMTGNVAVLAHLAGYGSGIAVAMLLLATGKLAREPYDLFTMGKQAARRRQFREVSYERTKLMQQGKHPDQAARRRTLDDAKAEALATARAEVMLHLGEDSAKAAAAYRKLLDEFRPVPGAVLLNRRAQYEIANALVEQGDHATAAIAYEVFLEGYPNDPETPAVRLMLGLISARYLNDPVRAKQEITTALPNLPEGGQRDLAQELLTELG